MIKPAFYVFVFLASVSAFAVTFDDFVGKYTAVSAPVITKMNNDWCDQFAFSKIVGFEVIADTNGYQQTHILYFVKPNGWSGHPVMEFEDVNPFVADGKSYARTTSAGNMVQNTFGTYWQGQDNHLTVSLDRQGSTYFLRMAEEHISESHVASACYYEVQLKK